MNASDVNYILTHLSFDARKSNGDKYPPRTMKSICLNSILWYFNNIIGHPWIISSPELKGTLDSVDAAMKIGTRDSVLPTAILGKREAITMKEEQDLWRKEILGNQNPQILSRTLVT
jgi:hypothetical protein